MPPKANVLIVDDVPVNRKLFMGFLRGLPLRCLEAENADQALEICRTHLVDLVITDIRMPGMDGFELSRLIRKSGIPVIGVTADARPHVMAQLEREFDTFLVKPLPQKTLVDNVTRLLPVALNDLVSRTHDSFEQYARRLWASLPEYPSLDELENFALSLAELAAQFSRHALAKDAKVAAGLCQEFRMEEALQWLQTLRVGQGHASRQPSDAASAGISEGIARR